HSPLAQRIPNALQSCDAKPGLSLARSAIQLPHRPRPGNLWNQRRRRLQSTSRLSPPASSSPRLPMDPSQHPPSGVSRRSFLAGADHPVEAWKKFFGPDDVVGIKVNPVGQKTRPNVIGAISSPAVLLEVVAGLKSAGVKPSNLIVFERYAREFRQAGYEAVMR